MAANDTAFAGSIPALYDRYLGPLIFAPYAEHVASLLSDLGKGRLLEVAAGTGIVTEALARRLPSADIVATDLNQAMVDHAASKEVLKRVKLRRADALALPFDDASFDAVVCQFGVMFYPDRIKGHREARRVLRPGGRYVFTLWDSLEHNPMTRCVVDAVGRRFPANPPRFLARTPHGHYDRDTVRREVASAGFQGVRVDTVTLPSRAPSPRDPAIGFCQGTPMRGEIEALAPQGLQEVTDLAASAVTAEFGAGPIEAPIRALVIVARK